MIFSNKHYKVLALSDLHIGKSNSVKLVDDIIYHFINNNREFSTVNYLVIAGDFFDKLVDLASVGFLEAGRLFNFLEKWATNNNVLILWVEGTESHDYEQVGALMRIKPENKTIKYYKEIDIFIDKRTNISVLFVPDNMGTALEIWAKVQETLERYGLKEVTMAVMHGVFDYQMRADHDNHDIRHDSKSYQDIVRDFIFIGHHHTFYPKGRIIPTGSFGRYKHGEEEPKGSTIAIVNGDTKVYKFMENINADIFMDIMSYIPIDKIIEIVKGKPDNSSFRFFVNDNNEELKLREALTSLPYRFKFEKRNKKEKEEIEKSIFRKFDLSKLNKGTFEENIKKMSLERLGDEYADEINNAILEVLCELK